MKTHQVFPTIKENGKFYSYQTGRYPKIVSNRSRYFFVVYNYDANVVLEDLIKKWMGKEILYAYEKIYDRLVAS